MTPPLFLIDDLPDGSEFPLTGDEGRHAARVKRIQSGETVLVADGRGTVLTCAVTGVRPDGLDLAVTGRRTVPEPDPRLVAVQALPKGERAELAVELLTELGADEIVPWAATRCVTRWDGPRGDRALDRWRRTAREAAKQSRRPWVPTVPALATTDDVAGRVRAAAAAFVLHEDARDPLASAPLPATGDVVVVIGPEGGITLDELTALADAGAVAVRLGEPVLRTSTAGAAAAAALSVRLGRWS